MLETGLNTEATAGRAPFTEIKVGYRSSENNQSLIRGKKAKSARSAEPSIIPNIY